MKLGEILSKERELILRSLAFSGVRVVIPLSNTEGRFRLSEVELSDQKIKEIHILNSDWDGIVDQLQVIGFKMKGKLSDCTVFAPKKEVLHGSGFTGFFKEGDLILVNSGQMSGQKAIIICDDSMVITFVSEKGMSDIWFDQRQMIDNLIYIRSTAFKYEFTDGKTLDFDFEAGYFKEVFE